MLRFCLLLTLTLGLFCFTLRQSLQAQTLPVPAGPGAPAINVTPTPPTTGTSVATPTSADKKKPVIIKYYEFKSVCIQPEVEKPVMSEAVKEKRLALIQQKLKKSEETKNKTQIAQIKALLIKEYIKQEKFSKAEELFKKEGVYLSESDQALISADIDVSKNLIRQAKNNLNSYLETHPKDIAAYEKIAEIYTLLGSHTEAKMALEDLSKMNSKKDYTAALCESSVLSADHVYIKYYCGNLIKKDSKNHLAYVYLGISLRDQEKYKEAMQNFKQSLKIKPSEFASTCLAESYALNKDYAMSIKQFEESVKINPNSKRAHLGLANTYVKNNLYPEALEQFKISCKLGLKPLVEMSTAANFLKTQKSELADAYFNEIQSCKN